MQNASTTPDETSKIVPDRPWQGPVPPLSLLLDKTLLESLSCEEASLLSLPTESIYRHTGGLVIPRQGQIQCFLSLHKNDTVYIAATGSGKTLIIAMMLLVHPDWLSVTISPLKELQRGQVGVPISF